MRIIILKSILCVWLLLLSTPMNFAREKVKSNQIPYAEGSTTNFEIVIEYNNIEPNKETKLTIYISDFKTNIPIENAKLEIDIPGIDVSKINILPSTEPGVYEVMTEFPEIRKYSFLLYITSGEISDVIAINDVDIGKTEEITDDHKESDSILSIFSGNILLITILIIFSIIIALVFYRLGLNKKTTEKLNDDYKITSSEERKI